MKTLLTMMILVAALAPQARAEDAKKARQYNYSATTHYQLGEYGEALKDWVSAFREKNEPSLLFNIAQCHRKLGHPAEAAQFYRSYLRSSPTARDREMVVSVVGEMDAAAARQAAEHPGIEIAPAPPTVRPTPAPSEPMTVLVVERIEPPSPPLVPPHLEAPIEPSPRSWYRDGWGLSLTTGALAALAVGTGLAVHGTTLSDEAADAAIASGRARLLGQAGGYSTGGYVALAAGGVLAVAAVIRWIAFARR